tara:strand:+ start:63 stop:257 length:195 start_codon:yes stop_codon:yes gene_type:complete
VAGIRAAPQVETLFVDIMMICGSWKFRFLADPLADYKINPYSISRANPTKTYRLFLTLIAAKCR